MTDAETAVYDIQHPTSDIQAAFALVFTVLFTVFLTKPGGLWDGIYEGLKYWLEQHGTGRGENLDRFSSGSMRRPSQGEPV